MIQKGVIWYEKNIIEFYAYLHLRSNLCLSKKHKHRMSNLGTLFGKNRICQNIGKTYVNFPAIYDGKRPDLNKALLNLIKRGGNYASYGSEPEGSDPYIGEVGYWYFNNCKLFPTGIRKIKALDYFYGHMMYFEEEGEGED